MILTDSQKKEIKEQQSQKNETKRVTAPELEKILFDAIPALDHGFVRVGLHGIYIYIQSAESLMAKVQNKYLQIKV